MPDIVLKDRNGNDITFPGINSIKVKTTNGGTQEFLNGEMVEKTVTPDFTEGDIAITAVDGTFISKVTIEKPEDLLPENIRNGKEIGGVAGSAFVVDMVDTVVMEETDYDGFVEAMTGVYVRDFDFSLVSGETYNVIWGTQKFVLQANTLAEYVYIGNASIVGMGEDTGEPFAVASGDGFTSVITNESGDSYHFGISQKTREDVETAEVELALADGDQEVIPSASDKVLTKVTIKKPETLTPENIAKDVDIAGVVGTLESGGGGSGDLGLLISRTIETVNFDAESVGMYAFAKCANLITAISQNAKSIADYAFRYCSLLSQVDFPSVESIGMYAFAECTALANVNLPSLTSCSGSSTFQYCKGLVNISLPALTSAVSNLFDNCKSLKTVDLPLLEEVPTYAFSTCSALTSVNLPSATSVGNSAFYNCTSLVTIDLPKVTSFGTKVFNGCTNLTALILRYDGVVSLSSTTTSNHPLYYSANAYVYVPSSQVSAYQSSTYWKNYSSKIRAIEDYPDICG